MSRRRDPDPAGIVVVAALLIAIHFYRNPELKSQLPLYVAISVGIIIAVVVAGIWWRRRTAKMLLGHLAFEDRMRRLTWEEFEQACAALFRRRGYQASLTPASGDEGIDILLRKAGQKDIVQCKHYTDRAVSVSEVRDLFGAKHDVKAATAYFVTSGFFSDRAREFAERNDGLVLWDRRQLATVASRLIAGDVAREVLRSTAPAEPAPVDPPETEPASEAEQVPCPRCGGELVVRRGRYGPFIGCSGYPDCRYTCDLADTVEQDDAAS